MVPLCLTKVSPGLRIEVSIPELPWHFRFTLFLFLCVFVPLFRLGSWLCGVVPDSYLQLFDLPCPLTAAYPEYILVSLVKSVTSSHL